MTKDNQKTRLKSKVCENFYETHLLIRGQFEEKKGERITIQT